MTEQDARTEALDLAAQAGVTSDWFVDVLIVKLIKWYHKGGIDALGGLFHEQLSRLRSTSKSLLRR
jgi:hypothetical protein